MNLIRSLFGKAPNDESPPLTAQELEEARKVFYEYAGNRLYMAQNDVHFEKYHIPREQEAAWRDELIAYWRSRLSTEDLTAVQKLRDAQAVEAIPNLLAMLDQGDSYARLRIAEAVWALSYWLKDKARQKQMKAAAVRSTRSILVHPIQVSEAHRIEIQRLGRSSPEKYITLFAKNVV